MDKELDRIERIEKIVAKAYKLARLVRRKHNKVTNIFNKNFEVFDDKVDRNQKNIDKIVNTLKELMGEEVDKKHVEQLINNDSERMYL